MESNVRKKVCESRFSVRSMADKYRFNRLDLENAEQHFQEANARQIEYEIHQDCVGCDLLRIENYKDNDLARDAYAFTAVAKCGSNTGLCVKDQTLARPDNVFESDGMITMEFNLITAPKTLLREPVRINVKKEPKPKKNPAYGSW